MKIVSVLFVLFALSSCGEAGQHQPKSDGVQHNAIFGGEKKDEPKEPPVGLCIRACKSGITQEWAECRAAKINENFCDDQRRSGFAQCQVDCIR